MTAKEAKETLRRTGRLEWKGVVVVKVDAPQPMRGNCKGKYNITRNGRAVNSFPLTLDQAIQYQLAI